MSITDVFFWSSVGGGGGWGMEKGVGEGDERSVGSASPLL